MIPEHLQERVTNSALLNYAYELEESVKYWKEQTEKAWATAKKWKEDADVKTDSGKQNET